MQANTSGTNAQSAGNYANSAFLQANNAAAYSANAFTQANAAFLQANTSGTNAQAAGTYANGAYLQANSAVAFSANAFTQANAAFTQANTGVTNALAASSYANSAFLYANTQVGLIAGVDLTQNTNTTAAFLQANAAFAKANTGSTPAGFLPNAVIFANTTGYLSNTIGLQFFSANNTLISGNVVISGTGNGVTFADGTRQTTAASGGGSGGSSSGYLANSVIFANTTGYLSNTSGLIFYASNNALAVTGNVTSSGVITGGGVRTTTTAGTAPVSPTAGDIWYDSSTDIIYRYNYDGTNNYWVDMSSASITSNASSSGISTGKAIAMALVFGG